MQKVNLPYLYGKRCTETQASLTFELSHEPTCHLAKKKGGGSQEERENTSTATFSYHAAHQKSRKQNKK